VSVSASSLSMLNPIIVNLELGLYGLLFAGIFLYIHRKFRKSGKLLRELQKEWARAEAAHAELLKDIHQRLATLTVETAAARPFAPEAPPVTSNVRNQVTSMGRRGMAASEIASSCGLPEGEVDVLLGMSRLKKVEI
jgi:hypothetical protein